jgi:hypothetical protein
MPERAREMAAAPASDLTILWKILFDARIDDCGASKTCYGPIMPFYRHGASPRNQSRIEA